MYDNQTNNAAYLRDPASAIAQRKYALAQGLMRQGSDPSATVGTGNTTMQAIARVLQGGIGGLMAGQVQGEADAYSEKMRGDEKLRQQTLAGLMRDPAAGPARDEPPVRAAMPDRLGGAGPATPEERTALGMPAAAPVGPVQTAALPPVAGRGAPTVPPDLAPIIDAAAAEHKIPAPLLTAMFQQESQLGRDPRATANGGGVPQIVGPTARDPGYGMPPISDADRLDPTKAIPWAARYLAARNPNVDWNDPTQRDAALVRYNGGGDPNYAANVTRHLPPGAPPQQVAAAPTPEPTPPGGVAARTGGTNMAGPGVPGAPQQALAAALAAPATPAQPAGETPASLRDRAARVAELGGAGSQQGAASLRERADALERRQFQSETTAETRRLAAEAAAERAAERAAATGERRADRADTNQRQTAQDAESKRRFELTETRRVVEQERREKLDADKANAPIHATEGERKAAGFLGRMQAEEAFIARMVAPKEQGGEGYAPGNVRDRVAAATPLVGNYLQTEEGQRYLASGAEWVRAKLRHESGAAIGQQEAIEEAKGYFPIPGDGEKAIADKAARRAVAIDGIRLAAGRLAPARGDGAKPEGGGAPVKVASPADAARLPKGTPIELPDGTIGRVP